MTTEQARPTNLQELEDEFLECRDFGHSWEWVTDFLPQKFGSKIVEMTRIVMCGRCETRRHDTFALPTMKRVGSLYYHRAGFRIHGQTGRILVAEVRREVLRRQKSKTWKK